MHRRVDATALKQLLYGNWATYSGGSPSALNTGRRECVGNTRVFPLHALGSVFLHVRFEERVVEMFYWENDLEQQPSVILTSARRIKMRVKRLWIEDDRHSCAKPEERVNPTVLFF